MSLFSNLFSKKSKPNQQDATDLPVNLAGDPFSGQPEATNESKPRETRDGFRPTVIRDFLSVDFWQQGYNHAIQFPVQERKNTAIVRIRADYRHAIQQAQQLLQSEIETHEQEVLRLGGVSNILDAQLQRRSRELESLAKALDHQLELSVDDEGWIAPVLAAYIDGFQVAALEYARMNNLLGGLTSLK